MGMSRRDFLKNKMVFVLAAALRVVPSTALASNEVTSTRLETFSGKYQNIPRYMLDKLNELFTNNSLLEYALGQIDAAFDRGILRKEVRYSVLNTLKDSISIIIAEEGENIFAPTGDGFNLQAVGINQEGWQPGIGVEALIFPLHNGLLYALAATNADSAITIPNSAPADCYYLGGYGNGSVEITSMKFKDRDVIKRTLASGRFENQSLFPMYLGGEAEGKNGPTILKVDESTVLVSPESLQDAVWTAWDVIKVNLNPAVDDVLKLVLTMTNDAGDPTNAEMEYWW